MTTGLDVSKWQAGRPRWVYTPALWFYFRMIEVAYLDARTQEDGKPTDDALLARDWIARSVPAQRLPGVVLCAEFVSFSECCEMLGLWTRSVSVLRCSLRLTAPLTRTVMKRGLAP